MMPVYYVEIVDENGDTNHKVFSKLKDARKCSKENGYAAIYNEGSKYVRNLAKYTLTRARELQKRWEGEKL